MWMAQLLMDILDIYAACLGRLVCREMLILLGRVLYVLIKARPFHRAPLVFW
jgi:hypothetical protein